VVSSVSLVPTNLVFALSGTNLTLSWPTDHTGWSSQMQTNSLAAGLGTNWVTMPGSDSTNQMTIRVDSEAGSVFFRLASP